MGKGGILWVFCDEGINQQQMLFCFTCIRGMNQVNADCQKTTTSK